jgi:hypothetical protein
MAGLRRSWSCKSRSKDKCSRAYFLMAANGSGKHCSDTQTVFDESMVLPNQIIRVFSRTVFESAYRGCPQRISRAARGEARPPFQAILKSLAKACKSGSHKTVKVWI